MRIVNDKIVELDDAQQEPMDDIADTIDSVQDAQVTADGTKGIVQNATAFLDEDPYEYA